MQNNWYFITQKNPLGLEKDISEKDKKQNGGSNSSGSSLTFAEEELNNVTFTQTCLSLPPNTQKNDENESVVSDLNQDESKQDNKSHDSGKNKPCIMNEINLQNNLNLIKEVVNNVLSLQYEITSFAGNQGDKKYLYLEDALVRHLVALDGISTNNNEELKYRRKEAVSLIQQHIDLLDAKTNERKKIHLELEYQESLLKPPREVEIPRQASSNRQARAHNSMPFLVPPFLCGGVNFPQDQHYHTDSRHHRKLDAKNIFKTQNAPRNTSVNCKSNAVRAQYTTLNHWEDIDNEFINIETDDEEEDYN